MSSTVPLDPIETTEAKQDTQFLDQTLRPTHWDEYIGQETIKNNLNILLTAATACALLVFWSVIIASESEALTMVWMLPV